MKDSVIVVGVKCWESRKYVPHVLSSVLLGKGKKNVEERVFNLEDAVALGDSVKA